MIFEPLLLSGIVFGDRNQPSGFAACRRFHSSPIEHLYNERSVERVSSGLVVEACHLLCSRAVGVAVAVAALLADVLLSSAEEVESRWHSHVYG